MTSRNNRNSSRTLTATAIAVAAFATVGVAQAGIDPDVNKSGTIGIEDLSAYMTIYLAGDKAADVDDNGMVSVQDLFNFIDAWLTEFTKPKQQQAPKGGDDASTLDRNDNNSSSL